MEANYMLRDEVSGERDSNQADGRVEILPASPEPWLRIRLREKRGVGARGRRPWKSVCKRNA